MVRRELAREIFLRSLAEIDVWRAMSGCVQWRGERLRIGDQWFELDQMEEILLIALGKAAVKMALGFIGAAQLSAVLGVVATNAAPDTASAKALADAGLEVFQGGHPAPN